jgi:hypothetical protein
MKLVDISGQILSSKNYGALNGSYQVGLNTSTYDSGVYFVEITINGTKVIKRFVIE